MAVTDTELTPTKRTLDGWIKHRGSSNSKLATAIGKTPSMVSKQRNHRRVLSVEDLKAYSRELNFDIHDLILR